MSFRPAPPSGERQGRGAVSLRTAFRNRRLTAAAVIAIVMVMELVCPTSAFADTAFFGSGSQLNPCESLSSPNGDYKLTMQCEGNLALSLQPEDREVWSTGTGGYPGSVLQMQADGNAVVYSPGHVAQWETGTAGNPDSVLGLQDDGNLVVIAPGNRPVWATDTVDAGKFVDTPRPGEVVNSAAATKYVALGDSYSSGEGLWPFDSPTNTDANRCHRSSQAYSQLMTNKPASFVACSGQTTSAFDNGKQTEGPQKAALGPDVGLVTMTFGGNDLNWTDTLKACFKIEMEISHNVVRADEKACRSALDQTPARIDEMKQSLISLYTATLQAAPNAQVRVLTYPPLFPLDRTEGGCRIGRFHPVQIVIAADVEHQFGLYEEQANLAIIDAVNQVAAQSPNNARLRVVDVETQFGGYLADGHTTSCGDTGRPEPWINSLRYDTKQAAVFALDAAGGNYDQLSLGISNVISASFHPTVEGQKQMYLAVQATLPE